MFTHKQVEKTEFWNNSKEILVTVYLNSHRKHQ
jgi:hypothetical protein